MNAGRQPAMECDESYQVDCS